MSPKDTYGYLFETLDIHPFLRIASKLVDADYSGAHDFMRDQAINSPI
jgi:hypothetical protein